MKRYLLTLIAALCLFASCTPDKPPVNPTPDGGSGGVAATGGTSAAPDPGTPSGGAVALGGSASTGGASVAIEWPGCSDQVRKANKSDMERYRKLLRKPYPMKAHPRASYVVVDNLPDVFWLPLAPTLNQRVGSCTLNASLQARISQPWTWSGSLDADELQDLAETYYHEATTIDPFRGTWPPDDTGSNGVSALTVMKNHKLVSGWVSVYSFDELQRQLQSGPCIMGVNWYTSMFSPDRCGQLTISGVPEGGHEVAIKAVQGETKRMLGLNSWGDEYGAKLRGQGGFFWLKFGDVQRLLNEGGEIECLRVQPTNDNATRAAAN